MNPGYQLSRRVDARVTGHGSPNLRHDTRYRSKTAFATVAYLVCREDGENISEQRGASALISSLFLKGGTGRIRLFSVCCVRSCAVVAGCQATHRRLSYELAQAARGALQD
jgi:hypothetical protein